MSLLLNKSENNQLIKEEEEEEEKKEDLEEKYDNSKNDNNDYIKIKICKHICEKKKRQCKFNALKNLDYCVEHLAFNKQIENAEKRVICPLDPKHSVYEKNLEKHLKKCNSRVKYLGDFDIKDINLIDKEDEQEKNLDFQLNIQLNNNPTLKNISNELKTYKELNDDQLKTIIELILEFDQKYKLYDLEYNKLENEFISDELSKKGDFHKKHLKQISSIVSHVDLLLSEDEKIPNNDSESVCMLELGAGRGKLSYWFDQSRKNKNSNDKSDKNINILLIERGSQRLKFDSLIKQTAEENKSEFERIRIDLKDLFVNKVPLIKRSSKFILYGKHLCGCATDFALRCLKHSLEDKAEEKLKFIGFVLAVCCHHVCEWNYFCGKEFLKTLGINSQLFYILRSISSWSTCGDRATSPSLEFIFGHNKQKIGRICKNLFDYARIQYLNNNIKLPKTYKLKTKLFYYVEPEVTLENSMIYASLEYQS